MSENIEKAELKDEAKVVKTEAKPGKKEAKSVRKDDKPKKKKKAIFSGMISELKKVTWPTKQDLRTYTMCVIVFVVLCSVLLGVMDWGIGKLINYISDPEQLPTVLSELIQ